MTHSEVVPEILEFIRRYGQESDYSSDELLTQCLQWYVANDRILVLKDDLGVVGVVAYHVVTNPSVVRWDKWPEEDPKGRYLFVPMAALHPLYRSRKAIHGLLKYALKVFPQLEYVYFERGNLFQSESFVFKLERYRKGELVA